MENHDEMKERKEELETEVVDKEDNKIDEEGEENKKKIFK